MKLEGEDYVLGEARIGAVGFSACVLTTSKPSTINKQYFYECRMVLLLTSYNHLFLLSHLLLLAQSFSIYLVDYC